MSSSVLDQLDDLLGAVALADDQLAARSCSSSRIMSAKRPSVGLGLLHRLGAHDVLDAHPVLELGRADDIEEDDARRRCARRGGRRSGARGCIPACRR